jgi:hypothetical protein
VKNRYRISCQQEQGEQQVLNHPHFLLFVWLLLSIHPFEAYTITLCSRNYPVRISASENSSTRTSSQKSHLFSAIYPPFIHEAPGFTDFQPKLHKLQWGGHGSKVVGTVVREFPAADGISGPIARSDVAI